MSAKIIDGFSKTENVKELIDESREWVLFRYVENKGLFFHFKREDSLSLVPMFMHFNPEFENLVMESLIALKENEKNENQ